MDAVQSLLRLPTADPVMRKELFGISRRRRTYFYRVLYIGVLWAFMLIVWNSWSYAFSGRSGIAQAGRALFSTFTILQMLMVTFSALSYSSDLVTREVRAGTLGLLLLTPLTAADIALGKWKACLMQVFLLILSGLPIVASCVYLGSVGPEEVLWTSALCFAYGAFAAGAGVVCSSVCRAGWAANLLALVTLLAVTLAPLLPGLFQPFVVGWQEWIDFVAWFHPVYATAKVLEYGSTWGSDLGARTGLCLAISLAVAVVFLLLSAARLPGLVDTRRGSAFGRNRRATPYPVRGNPILWKERRFTSHGAVRIFYWLATGLAAFGVLSVPALANDRSWDALITIILCLGTVVVLVAGGVGASLFAKEKENHEWETLLVTPLTSGQIVFGKLLGGVWRLLPLGIASLLYCFVAGLLVNGAAGAFMLTATVLLYGAFLYLTGAYFSIKRDTTRAAFKGTVMVFLISIVVLPIFFGLLRAYPLVIVLHPGPFFVASLMPHSRGIDREIAGYFIGFFFVHSLACSILMGITYGALNAETSRR